MHRLIDGDLLMKTVFNDVVLVDGEVKGVGLILAETVDKAPTIDAVPVVRCAKCEHWVKNDDGQYVCALFDIANSYGEPVVTKPDDFCSYGKRKGEVD